MYGIAECTVRARKLKMLGIRKTLMGYLKRATLTGPKRILPFLSFPHTTPCIRFSLSWFTSSYPCVRKVELPPLSSLGPSPAAYHERVPRKNSPTMKYLFLVLVAATLIALASASPKNVFRTHRPTTPRRFNWPWTGRPMVPTRPGSFIDGNLLSGFPPPPTEEEEVGARRGEDVVAGWKDRKISGMEELKNEMRMKEEECRC